MKPATKKRARKVLKTLKIQPPKPKKEKTPGCLDKLRKRMKKEPKVPKVAKPKKKKEKKPPPTQLSPQMKKANNEGYSMVKNIAFPALPAIFQDLWVYLELVVTIAAFAFAMLDFFPIEGDRVYTYSYLGLTIFAMILALFDAYVYFIELGSCGRAIRYICTRSRGPNDSEVLIVEEDDEIKGKGCFKANWKQNFSTFFELGRNLASELILYPLLVFDLFDFVVDVGYRPEGSIGRADFSLFVVGSFYLLLAVYMMRVFVIGGSMFSLIQVSSNKNAGQSGDNDSSKLLIKFCLHILGQIAVHLTIILAVGAKINNENPIESVDDFVNETLNETMLMLNETLMEDSGLPNVSPFLWVVIVLGWLLPMVGVAMFFLINMYWMREFSIGFWVNMISLLQGASFAETVFGGDGLSATKDQATSFVENSEYKKVKKQLKRFKSPSFWTKFFYPTRVPYAALSGLIYDVVILTYVAALMLTYQDGAVSIVVFQDDHIMTVAFLVSALCIIVANIHVLVLLNFLLLIIVTILALSILFAMFMSPLVLFLYFPVIGVIGYAYLFTDCGCCKRKKETEDASDTKDANEQLEQNGEVLENTHALEFDREAKIEMEDFELPAADLRETSVTTTSM